MRPIIFFHALNGVIDADALSFIQAAGITDNTQKRAVNELVVSLKNNLLWTKAKAIYPIVGGTASSHKWNLKDPRDLDAAYRIAFSGTSTHSSNGITGNGTTGYGNTFFNASTGFTSNSVATIAVYIRNNINYGNTQGVEIGCGVFSGGLTHTNIWPRFNDIFYGQINSIAISESVANLNSTGFYLAGRNSTAAFIQKNSTQNNFTTTVAATNLNIYFGASNNNGTPDFFSGRQSAFGWISDGLTTAQASTLYTIVQTYQTTLSRNV